MPNRLLLQSLAQVTMEPFSGISLLGLSLSQLTIEGLNALPSFLGKSLGEDYATNFSKHAIESVLRRAKDAEPAANHDLPRAIRRSSLLATTILVRHYRLFAQRTMPGSPWTDWCDRLTRWLREETIQNQRADYRVPANPADHRFTELVSHGEQPQETFGGELQKAVIAGLEKELREWHEREWANHHPNFSEPPAVFLQWLAAGWPFVEERRSFGGKIVAFFTRRRGSATEMHRRSQAALPDSDVQQTLHWFSLFSAFFTEEIKTNARIHAIFDAKLLIEINDRLKLTSPPLNPAQLSDWLTGELDNWGHKFCGNLDKLRLLIEASQKETADHVADLFDRLAALDATLDQRNKIVLDVLSRFELKVDSVKEDTSATRVEIEHLKVVVDQLRREFEKSGRNPSDLSERELYAELARREPDLTADRLRRLIAYARFNADVSKIFTYAPTELIGREKELRILNDAWAKVVKDADDRPSILTFVALGGEGKTSLVAKWVVDEMLGKCWPGCDAAFAWSFYSQGTREQIVSSSDLFLKAALTFFGDDSDKAFAASPASAYEKGQRLARLVGQRRSLLILDGLEPLQYAPTAPTPGALMDQGLVALIKGLAAASHGLCIITTRYSLPDVKAFWKTTAPEIKLLRLPRDAGVYLLKSLGVKGSERRNIQLKNGSGKSESVNEFEKLVEDVKGHALTLTLLGVFLKRAFDGDIRQRDHVNFERADKKTDGGHAFRTLAAYEQWLLRDGGEEGIREVAILRLMGLFDRPAATAFLYALLQPPVIPGLSEPLIGLSEADWEFCLTGLEETNLITVNRDEDDSIISIDTHPHIREYFAMRLSADFRSGWVKGHKRIYSYICNTVSDRIVKPSLEDIQPLYQAVVHGCNAELHVDVYLNLLRKRVFRCESLFTYSCVSLGAVDSDLAALSHFFDEDFKNINKALSPRIEGEILLMAGFLYSISGRLAQGIKLLQASVEHKNPRRDSGFATQATGVLSTYELLAGYITKAIEDAGDSNRIADDLDGDEGMDWKIRAIAALGNANFQAGDVKSASSCFDEFFKLLKSRQKPPGNPALISLIQYSDYLFSEFETKAWKYYLGLSSEYSDETLEACATRIEECSKLGVEVSEQHGFLSFKGGNLTSLFKLQFFKCILGDKKSWSDNLVFGNRFYTLDEVFALLRSGGQRQYLPRTLLLSAWIRAAGDQRGESEDISRDLDEALEIAGRGPMKLFKADIYLYRARLFFHCGTYPWKSPQSDLSTARKLIEECGYWRRKEELEDAERVIGTGSAPRT